MEPPSFYLFAGCNGAGKTTFARAYLTQFETPPRFLNADEIARGLSPLAPQTMAIKAGRLLLQEIDACLQAKSSFALESTLSGHAHVQLIQRAKALGYRVEIHYLWLPSPKLAVHRIAQRVKMGGHHIPETDVIRRYRRSIENFTGHYAASSDVWAVWDNKQSPAELLLHSEQTTLDQLRLTLCSRLAN